MRLAWEATPVNVFAHTINPSENGYAFPPLVLMGPLLMFLLPNPCPLTKMFPDLRPRQYWWPILKKQGFDQFQGRLQERIWQPLIPRRLPAWRLYSTLLTMRPLGLPIICTLVAPSGLLLQPLPTVAPTSGVLLFSIQINRPVTLNNLLRRNSFLSALLEDSDFRSLCVMTCIAKFIFLMLCKKMMACKLTLILQPCYWWTYLLVGQRNDILITINTFFIIFVSTSPEL